MRTQLERLSLDRNRRGVLHVMMKRLSLLFALPLLLILGGCTTITVSSPSGCAVATYKGTTLIGDEAISCVDGPTSGCTVGGQNPQQLIATIMGALVAGGIIAAAHQPSVAPPAPVCHQAAS